MGGVGAQRLHLNDAAEAGDDAGEHEAVLFRSC
jgi:hypothetical protein